MNYNHNSEVSKSISTPQSVSKHPHQFIQPVSENLVTEPELTTPVKPVRPWWLNGLTLRKMLVISLTVTGTLVGIRFFGFLEWFELKAYDHFMQLRLHYEQEDPRLLIVKITDEDIIAQDKRGEQGFGNSLRDPSLNRLLKTLQKHQPRLIGLDFYRNFPGKSSVPGLEEQLKQKNIVAVCKVPKTNEQGEKIGPEVAPPKEIKSFGFSDFVTDRDDRVRRHLMAQDRVAGTACGTTESFSLLLARRYLEQELGKNLNYINPIIAAENLRFGNVIFQQLQPFTGGYQDVDSSGFQVLLNYRATTSGNVANLRTLEEVLNNKFSDEDIRNRIVLIGSYAEHEGPPDMWSTPYNTMYGIMDNEGQEVYSETFPLNKQNLGIIGLKLPTTSSLKQNNKYRWIFSAICNPQNRAADAIVNGWLERIPVSSGLNNQLKAASAKQRVSIYTDKQLWYETLTNLADLQRRNPQDTEIKSTWANVLQLMGLPKNAPQTWTIYPLPTQAENNQSNK